MEEDPLRLHALFTLLPQNEAARRITDAPNNSHLARKVKPMWMGWTGDSVVTGLQINLHFSNIPRCTIATIGREDADILLVGDHFPRLQCSFEIHEDTHAIMLRDRSSHNTTQFHGDSAQPFRPGIFPRQAVINEETNLEFSFGGPKVDMVKFYIYWHQPEGSSIEELIDQYISLLTGNPRVLEPHEISRPAAGTHALMVPYKVRYRRENLLGRGQFGQVYKVVNIVTNEEMAMKEIVLRGKDPEEDRKAKREAKIHAKLHHLNIIAFRGQEYEPESRTLRIFLPLQDGNLKALKNQSFFTENDGIETDSLVEQMLRALDYLASMKIIHRDVKPENILYKKLRHGSVQYVLSDFGLSNLVRFSQTTCGSPLYQAPEINEMTKNPQTTKADVWSLFVTLASVLNIDDFDNKPIYDRASKLKAIAEAARVSPLGAMACEDPIKRASAGKMLEEIVGGRGRITLRSPSVKQSPVGLEKAWKGFREFIGLIVG